MNKRTLQHMTNTIGLHTLGDLQYFMDKQGLTGHTVKQGIIDYYHELTR